METNRWNATELSVEELNKIVNKKDTNAPCASGAYDFVGANYLKYLLDWKSGKITFDEFCNTNICETNIKAAHYYAHDVILSNDFPYWNLADDFGRTVAHEAAKYGTLPEDFDKFGLSTKKGWTVAHEYVKHGHLPKGFYVLDYADNNGLSVKKLAILNGLINKPDNINKDISSDNKLIKLRAILLEVKELEKTNKSLYDNIVNMILDIFEIEQY